MITGFFCSALTAQSSQNITFWSNLPHEQLCDAIISQMSDEELFAQILMFGWAGSEPSPLL
ncbi:MAG TPA: glycoside hydrolase family 3 protein, partial [Treponemataceae bacterium]|nr:glycoside hydrolase family 3 protein [Treponemataceae bacterium]